MKSLKASSKSVVLLSAGLDSSVNLWEAARTCQVVLALTFDYGQRAALREISSAQKLCRKLKVPHHVISIPWLKNLGSSSLTHSRQKVPSGSQVKIDSLKASQKSAKSVWVPNRNGMFLNIAAAFAESLGAGYVIPGFNVEEAATFPDNTQAFLSALDKSFSFSTANGVKTHCFTTALNKTQIVKRGQKLELPFQMIWPCYHGGKKWCGQCESCKRSVRALAAAGVDFSNWIQA